MPLVPEDFASHIIMNKFTISQAGMNSINLDILDNERGRPSENRKLSSRLRTFILKTKAQRQKRPFARVLTIHPTVLTGRIRRICLGPLESRKQSFVAAWPYVWFKGQEISSKNDSYKSGLSIGVCFKGLF